MSNDIRIAIGFWTHHKTVKLERRLGLVGVKSLLILWSWAAQNRPQGLLVGMDAEDIEIAAMWSGDTGALFKALSEIAWIDFDGTTYSLHGWAEHQPWVVGSEARKEKAKKAISSRWEKARRTKQEYSENTTRIPVVIPSSSPCLSSSSLNSSPSPDVGEVLQEDKGEPQPLTGAVCAYCGVRQSDVDWGFEVDHFIPKSAGGTDDESNLVISCHVCNQIKQKRIFKSIAEAREHIHWTIWASGRKRYEKARMICFGGVQPTGDVPETVRQGDGPLGTGRLPVAYSKNFEMFWAIYPRKVGKGGAYRAWKKIAAKYPDVTTGVIIDALKAQIAAEQWTNERGQDFVPNPETWINQARWQDEVKGSGGSSWAAERMAREQEGV